MKPQNLFVALVLTLCVRHPAVAAPEMVSGRIGDAHGKPAAVTVYFSPFGHWTSGQREFPTAEDGTFSIPLEENPHIPLPPAGGSSQDDVRGAIFVESADLGVAIGWLRAGQPNQFRLAPGRTVQGSVRNEKDEPVAGAALRASSFGFGFGLGNGGMAFPGRCFVPPALAAQFTTTSEADGTWRLQDVPLHASVMMVLESDDYLRATLNCNPPELPGPANLQILARRAGSISGRVTDAGGNPVAGVPVWAQSEPAGDIPGGGPRIPAGGNQVGMARSGADGSFVLNRLLPGSYSVLVADPAARLASQAANPSTSPLPTGHFAASAITGVKVVAGLAAAHNDLRLVNPAMVQGRVVERVSGRPVAGASVGAFGPSWPEVLGQRSNTVTDEEGRFLLDLVPGDNAFYAYEFDGWSRVASRAPVPQLLHLEAGVTATPTLRIDRVSSDLEGRTVDETGKPIGGVNLLLWSSGGDGIALHSDGAGQFSLKHLRPGPQRPESEASWTVLGPAMLDLSPGFNGGITLTVRPELAYAVRGRVVDTAGKPVPAVQLLFYYPVTRRGSDSMGQIRVFTDDDGYYSLLPIRAAAIAGLHLQLVMRPGYRIQQAPVGPATMPAVPPASVSRPGDSANAPRLEFSDTVLEYTGAPRGVPAVGNPSP